MEFNLNEPRNIVGLSGLLQDDSNLSDIHDLEREIISGIDIQEEEDDIAKQYQRDMDNLSKKFDISNFEDDEVQDEEPQSKHSPNDRDSSESRERDTREMRESRDDRYSRDSRDEYSHRREDNLRPIQKWSSRNLEDDQLRFMTNEQKKQNHIHDVLDDVDDDECDIDLEKEKEEDSKNILLERIDMLRQTLEEDNVELKNIPVVNKNNDMADITSVYKILRLKNDRNRYSTFAEELILSGAQSMEYLFDGRKDWFGRKPDLIGWSSTVKVKLRRMRYETSTFVQEIMNDYNMSSGVRLMIELLPSMFLYSRSRKLATNASENQFNDAISDLNEQFS